MSETNTGAHESFGHRLLITCFDTVLIACAILLAVLLRFDGGAKMTEGQWLRVVYFSPVMLAVYVATMLLFRLGNVEWRYAGLRDILKLVAMCLTAVVFNLLVNKLVINYVFRIFYPQFEQMLYPRLVILFSGVIAMALLCTSRYIWILMQDFFVDAGHKHIRRVLIIGADADGVKLADRIRQTGDDGVRHDPVAFLDEDLEKLYRKVGGIPVEGTLADVSSVVKQKRIDEIILNTRDVPIKLNRDAYVRALRAHCLPLIMDDENGLCLAKLEDLLDADCDMQVTENARAYFQGKRACVVGAATHVGIALIKQLAACGMESITLMDADEDRLSMLKHALDGCVNIRFVLPGAGNLRVLQTLFDEARPEIVIYLRSMEMGEIMDENPLAVARLNVLGVRDALEAARVAGAHTFGYLSSASAYAPTDVGGASRALAEALSLTSADECAGLRVLCARAEPVIESPMSELYQMRTQVTRNHRVEIHEGGEVTHISARNVAIGLMNILPHMESGVYSIEPGDPVDEDQLARALIRSLGMEPEKDVEIVVTPRKQTSDIMKDDADTVCDETPLARVTRAPRVDSALNACIASIEEATESGNAQKVKEIFDKAIVRKA